MLLQIGTLEEQWRDVGIEVALGRLTAQEVFDEGKRILAGFAGEADAELSKRTGRLEARVIDAENEAHEARDEADALKDQMNELKDELRAARRQQEEYAREIRALERQVKDLEDQLRRA